MKGVILGINPDVRIVDISHDIAPQDVMEGAFVVRDAAYHFPADTIHVIVVDPGVGTARRPVALRCRKQFFVGPDNGILPLLLDGTPPERCVELDDPSYWRSADVSTTFHGRDIFAPAAAHLSAGVELDRLGSKVDALTPMQWALPITDEQGVQGWVVHVDRFGNCITNVSREMIEERRGERPIKCFVGSAILEGTRQTYASVEAGEPLMHYNSSDMLEVSVNSGNAAELLSIRKGDPVNILFREPR